jgi:hypothetical protein
MEVQVRSDAWLGSEGHEAFDVFLAVVTPGEEQGDMVPYFYFARKHHMVMG